MSTRYKNLIYTALCLMGMALGTTACSSEWDEEQTQQTRPAVRHLVVGTEWKEQTATRISYGGPLGLTLLWSEGDAISLLTGSEVQKPARFTLTGGKNTQHGLFEGDIACSDGAELYAIYPALDPEVEVNPKRLLLDISQQSGQLDGKNHVLLGKGTYHERKSPTIQFSHRVLAVQIQMLFPAGTGALKHIILRDCYSYMEVCSQILNVLTGDAFFQDDPAVITVANPPAPEADGSLVQHFYLMTNQFDMLRRDGICLEAETEDGTIYRALLMDDRTLEAGLYYKATGVQMVPDVDFANEATADGSAEAPYEIANFEQLQSLSIRVNACVKDEYYVDKHYRLTADVRANADMEWVPIGLLSWFRGSFDGGGHTISGTLDTPRRISDAGLFGYLWNGTVSHLRMDARLVTHGTCDRVGVLAVNMDQNARLEDCCNLADQTVTADYLAGLVARCGESTIEACWNEGTLVNESSDCYVGGLVAMTSGDVKIKGCYNKGSLRAPVDEMDTWVAGLVARERVDLSVKACWNGAAKLTGDYVMACGYDGQSYDHTYWRALPGVEPFANDTSATSASFAGATPDAEQIKAMNEAWVSDVYQFNAQGEIVRK